MRCNPDIELEPISFIGGNAETLCFDLYDSQNRPYDLTSHTCTFYLSTYSTRSKEPILTKIGEICANKNSFTVRLDSADTKHLSGKYLYQISVTYDGAEIYEAGQGFCTIINNINRGGI